MGTQQPTNGRLDGWKAIADYLGWHTRTVMRWEDQKGLPVHRVPGGHRNAVYAWRQEIDDWLRQGAGEIDKLTGVTAHDIQVSEFDSGEPDILDGLKANRSELGARFRSRVFRHWALWAIGVLLLFIASAFTLRTVDFPPKIHFTGAIQLTDDGHQKQGLVSDGVNLYFSEIEADRMVLASVPVDGGTIHRISTPFLKVVPVDVSRNRSELLVLVQEGAEDERAPWILPLDGRPARPLGTVRCHEAAWSPDSTAIVFAFRNGIYMTRDEGTSTHVIQEFDRVPKLLRWSPDGQALRFFLKAPNDYEASLWQLTFDRGAQYEVGSLEPLHILVHDPASFVFEGIDRSFVTANLTAGGEIMLIKPLKNIGRQHLSLMSLERRISGPSELVLNTSSNRMFAVGASGVPNEDRVWGQVELLKLGPLTKQFERFLPGISAREVDFSPDGRMIAFVKEPSHELWISTAAGTEQHQINFTAADIELPRWSPNGKSIAFMARADGSLWRIFIASLADGHVTEALNGDDNQGAPTWSPDGRSIVYGNVRCQEALSCAIHIIDLADKKQTIIPGSDGLGTARWSPDGRFVAALASEKHLVMIFDVKGRQWRQLLDNVNGNDLAWSRDSRFVYASRTINTHPEIIRVPPTGGKPEMAADLTPLANLSGHPELWFALSSDGSFVLAHSLTANEIFALPYQTN